MRGTAWNVCIIFLFFSGTRMEMSLSKPAISGVMIEPLESLERQRKWDDVPVRLPFAFHPFIVSRGDWLWKPVNIKVENNGAAVYGVDRAQSFVFRSQIVTG